MPVLQLAIAASEWAANCINNYCGSHDVISPHGCAMNAAEFSLAVSLVCLRGMPISSLAVKNMPTPDPHGAMVETTEPELAKLPIMVI